MVTPTGAAVVKALARPAPVPCAFEIERVGYGAGTKEFSDRPNVLRMIIGQERQAFASDEMVEIADQYRRPQPADLRSPGGAAVRRRRARRDDYADDHEEGQAGRDARGDRRSRDARAARGVLFAETSTIGIRFHPVARLKLNREIVKLATRWGEIRVKVSGPDGGAPATLAPEYEDCRRAALAHRVPLRQVMEDALAAARKQLG